MKKYLFEVLESTHFQNPLVRQFRFFIMGLIALNVIAVILETVDAVGIRYAYLFRAFELVSVIIFSLEYILRVAVCTENPDYPGAVGGRLRFMLTPLALVDLLAILPFYLPFFFPIDLRFIRAVRLIRVFRILKFGRYSESLKLMIRVFKDKKEELLITLFTIMVLLIIASSLMYYFENEVQPDKYGSIPQTMWWALITLTTVGYGDVYPVTVQGKVLGSILALLGVGIFALPAAILASAFSQQIKKGESRPQSCPKCGAKI